MPKEIVSSGLPNDVEQFRVIVGWQRDYDVQVGIQTADGLPLLNHLKVIEADSSGVRNERPSDADGLWQTLSRSTINDLIRVLRRARDAAYGRDE